MSSAMFIRSARRVASVTARQPITPAVLYSRRYSSTVHDNDPDVLESEKARNLSNKQHKTSTPHAHAPGWNEYLASASEAAIKADKSEDGPEVLLRKSVEHIRARHHADDVTRGVVEAEYERDEIEGPLKGAMGRVTETVEETVEKLRGKT